MKREIKFRAWIPNTGWLAEGFSIAMDGTEWYDDNGHSWPVCDLELMQFTGLKDKNGREIYEGDILDFDEREWGGRFKPEVIWMENIIGDWNYCGSLGDVTEWRKVIGNIYENPELLKA